MVRYADFKQSELDSMELGCGGKGMKLKPPNWCFLASCIHHDLNYAIGYTEEHRKKADEQFYIMMKKDAANSAWYLRPSRYLGAKAYYTAVRWFGKKFFNYNIREATKEEILFTMAKTRVG